jgi:hypothetical protein
VLKALSQGVVGALSHAKTVDVLESLARVGLERRESILSQEFAERNDLEWVGFNKGHLDVCVCIYVCISVYTYVCVCVCIYLEESF